MGTSTWQKASVVGALEPPPCDLGHHPAPASCRGWQTKHQPPCEGCQPHFGVTPGACWPLLSPVLRPWIQQVHASVPGISLCFFGLLRTFLSIFITRRKSWSLIQAVFLLLHEGDALWY